MAAIFPETSFAKDVREDLGGELAELERSFAGRLIG
jgi:hypothetical protein